MTWFETEQMYHYIARLETALDEWRLTKNQMKSRYAELLRLQQKLNKEISAQLQPPQKNVLLELFDRAEQCQLSIVERLKY